MNAAGKRSNIASESSAAPAALGFVFQFQVALMQLLPLALSREEGSVSLEILDDVELSHRPGRPPELIQVHQSGTGRPLSDRSPKVWRTLAIWAEHIRTVGTEEAVSFVLHTTQTATEGSGIAALTQRGRNVDDAISRLEAVATDSEGSSRTAADRAAFLELGEAQRRALLAAVSVIDQATAPVDVRKALIKQLTPTNEAQYIESMADTVEGWWWSRIPSALAAQDPIHAGELRSKIDEARRMHSEHALPIHPLDFFGDEDLPESNLSSAQFMACLVAIAAKAIRKREASSDYRLAAAHRSRWARKGLLGTGEIKRYEKNLFQEWLVSSDRMIRNLDGEDDAQRRASVGHNLWDEMERIVLPPIRRDTTATFIQRGSFHLLAEDDKVAWHPDAVEAIHRQVEREP